MHAPDDTFRLAIRGAVESGYLNPKQAAQIAARIVVRPEELPGGESLNTTITPDVWPLIFLELLSLSKNDTGRARVPWQEAQRRIAAMKIEDWMRIHEQLQDEFQKKNSHLAFLLFTGALSISAWRSSFWYAVKNLILSQATLGARATPADLVMLAEILKREADFVQRFANAVFAGKTSRRAGVQPGRRTPTSEAQIKARGDLYTGTARGMFYKELEGNMPLQLGWVIQYIARDDANTCKPCHEAEGYYLPNTGPYPGMVCEGQGLCRCVRKAIYFPEMREKLLQQVP